MTKHKVFISYHHENDQWAKEELLKFNEEHQIFIDGSVDTGDIDDKGMADEVIREKIRDEYLKDTTVTILLVGKETKNRKHIDWELYSSMRDGKINKKSGILVIQLPSTKPEYITAAHGYDEKKKLYPDTENWISIDSRAEYERRYPYLPERIIDNLLAKNVKISVTKWDDLDAEKLQLLIDLTFKDKESCQYDFSRQMRHNNS
ncbi:TIR domain-containing protein [Rodentibacter haemolyticus]|uniref:TIR domain-containing protein n=1 Tax=Rodentibacter haemolyticus TaxID=2778911 RepID=A0ABX6UXV1_9PAST|nr:TIR domain-containing protein [Rodentibacter haemolyticus]QPB41911.1 TIR domain-containing protein [Rodentibacter haemolyticus]